MDRAIHPAETALFVAAALRGFRLEDTQDGRLYRVLKGKGDAAKSVADRATFKDVANLCGAIGNTTLRQAAERDGLAWPDSPEAFLATMNNI